LDYSLEIFKRVGNAKRRIEMSETLGEHLFIQLKSRKSVEPRPLKIYRRHNVEKQREVLDKTGLIGSLSVVSQRLEATELATIERMGVGVPVLLVVADLTLRRCYFVCLNDYIDKILVPRFGPRAASKSRTIEVPVTNVLTAEGKDDPVIRWYAKRAKLYAAFQRFTFQYGNLENEVEPSRLIPMAQYFAERIAYYDFWDDTEIWEVLHHYGKAIRHFLATGNATRLRLEPGITEYERSREDPKSKEVRSKDILRLWCLLASFPGNYEDVCREWFLPSAMGYLTRYAPSDYCNSFEDKYARPRC